MTEQKSPSKEQRLKALLEQPPQERKPDLPGARSRRESKDLGEAAGARKCSNIRCNSFAEEVPILVRGTEVLTYAMANHNTVSDQIENSHTYWEPVDAEDGTCPKCERNTGCLPPGSRSILAGIANPDLGVSNDREAVAVKRNNLKLPPLPWQEKANGS
jgi:hypothetical protein